LLGQSVTNKVGGGADKTWSNVFDPLPVSNNIIFWLWKNRNFGKNFHPCYKQRKLLKKHYYFNLFGCLKIQEFLVIALNLTSHAHYNTTTCKTKTSISIFSLSTMKNMTLNGNGTHIKSRQPFLTTELQKQQVYMIWTQTGIWWVDVTTLLQYWYI